MYKFLKIGNFKETFDNFSMQVTTTHRDCDKINKIVPIMQEHLGHLMNLARIKLLAFVLHALCVVQTARLHKFADSLLSSINIPENVSSIKA